MITNPILKGFNPDPSIIRVDDVYYIATSTFDWYPGVQIHQSKDLKNWELITHPLDTLDKLDMRGNPDSGGIWAPCLSYSEGTYYLVFTDVKSHIGPFKDTHNYLVTAKNIMGPWSDPIYLNSSGFDPSLFHDDDGKRWHLNLVWDHRKGKNPFGGIVMQEYSECEKKLVGPIYNIFKGTNLGLTEAPHLYKNEGYYYLMTAEGGTRYNHAVTVARSQSITGPYEVDPLNPILTSAKNPDLELQKAGHASVVETQDNELYLVHLCGRPLKPSMNCTLGRETAIQQAEWTEDGWIRLIEGNTPKVKVAAPNLAESPVQKSASKDEFNSEKLNVHFSTLKRPFTEDWASLTERKGYLRITGGESFSSNHRQSLVARRQQSFEFVAETSLQFEPKNYQQMAGMTYYYNKNNNYYLFISYDEEIGVFLNVMSILNWKYDEHLVDPILLNRQSEYKLRAKISYSEIQFYYYSELKEKWTKVGPVLDASLISDDNAEKVVDDILLDQGFTGAFIGMCCQDLSGQNKKAYFDYFTYRENS